MTFHSIGLFFEKWLFKAILFIFLFGPMVVFPASNSFSGENEKVTRQEFIDLIARHNPENPFLPKNYFQISLAKRYSLTVENLNRNGFRVLNGKDGNSLLSQVEFVRSSYAFTGAPLGKSLHEQKLYLKNAGIIQSSDIGLATEVQGRVVQIHKGSSSKVRTELASPVFMQDKIRTDQDSKARFTLDDGSTLTVAEDSIVRITKNVYDPDKDFRQMLIEVSLGTVRFVVTKVTAKGSMFKVVTPTVTAGVRGTEFIVAVAADGASRLIGIEGEIETRAIIKDRPSGKARILAKNQTQSISKNGIAGEINKAAQKIIKNVVKKTTLDRRVQFDRKVSKVIATAAAKNKIMRGRIGKKVKSQKEKEEKGNLSKEKDQKNNDSEGSEAEEAEEEAAEEAEEAAEEAAEQAEEAAKDAAEAAEEAAKDAAEAAEEAAKDAAEAAEEAAKDAAEAAEEAAKDAAEAAEEAAKDAAEAAEEAAKDAAEAAEEAAKDAAEAAEEAAEDPEDPEE
jgi:hypothetical protein